MDVNVKIRLWTDTPLFILWFSSSRLWQSRPLSVSSPFPLTRLIAGFSLLLLLVLYCFLMLRLASAYFCVFSAPVLGSTVSPRRLGSFGGEKILLETTICVLSVLTWMWIFLEPLSQRSKGIDVGIRTPFMHMPINASCKRRYLY